MKKSICIAALLLGGLTSSLMAAETAVETEQKSAKSDWSSLEAQVGKYPFDTGLYTRSPIVPDLKKLLGKQWKQFITNMGVSSPLSKDKVLYVTGNKPHEGGSEMAYLLIDPACHALEVGLIHQEKLQVFRTPGEWMSKPQDVQILLENANISIK